MDPNYYTSSAVAESNMNAEIWWNNNDDKEST
jgi:hypothetical protein